MRLNNRIRELRQLHDLTQQQLAELTMVSRQTIISLEQGRYNPTAVLAYRIAKVFGMIIEDVFDFSDEEETL